MRRTGRNTLILLVIGLLALALGATWAGSGDDADRVERKAKVRWVVSDDDGVRHEEVIEIDGARPFLGVQLESVDGGGARIESIVEDSAAERSDLREGDVIVGFDGDEIESPWDLTRAVLHSEPGSRVDVEVMRNGSRETVRVEIGEKDDWVGAFAFGDGDGAFDMDHLEGQLEQLHDMQFDFDFDFDFDGAHLEQLEEHLEQLGERLGQHGVHGWMVRSSRPRLGVQLVDVTGDLREHLGSNRDEGLLVAKVIDDTPAEEAGMRTGDLITAIDGEPVGRVRDLQRLLRERDGQVFDVEVIRDGSPMVLTVSLPEREADELHEHHDHDAEPSRHLQRHRHQPAPAVDRT